MLLVVLCRGLMIVRGSVLLEHVLLPSLQHGHATCLCVALLIAIVILQYHEDTVVRFLPRVYCAVLAVFGYYPQLLLLVFLILI